MLSTQLLVSSISLHDIQYYQSSPANIGIIIGSQRTPWPYIHACHRKRSETSRPAHRLTSSHGICLWAACHNHRSEVVFRADACVEGGRGEMFECHSRSCTGRVNNIGRSTAILTSWSPGCARIHACCWRDRDDRQQRDRSRSAGCGQVLRVLLTRRC
jgi:hypothetical protein